MSQHSVVPSEDRVAKWDLKYNASHVKDVIEAGKPQFLAHAKGAFVDAEQMELAVKQCIDAIGVQPKDVPQYLNAGRQFAKACRTYAGETLNIKAQTIQNRWTEEGLVTSVLKALKRDVFHIPEPVVPEPA